MGFILPNLLLIQKVYFKILKGLKGLVWRVLCRKLDRFLSYLRKRTFSRNDHSMSFAFTRYHSLSLVVTRCTTHCHTLSFVVPLVIRFCTIHCHSLSHDVSLVCYFVNNHLMVTIYGLTVFWSNCLKVYWKVLEIIKTSGNMGLKWINIITRLRTQFRS